MAIEQQGLSWSGLQPVAMGADEIPRYPRTRFHCCLRWQGRTTYKCLKLRHCQIGYIRAKAGYVLE